MAKRVTRVYHETIPDAISEIPQEELVENLVENHIGTPEQVFQQLVVPKLLSELDNKLADIIQNSGSFEKEMLAIKNVIKHEITLAFNQGCVNGNGAARGAHSGEVYNLYEYLGLRGL